MKSNFTFSKWAERLYGKKIHNNVDKKKGGKNEKNKTNRTIKKKC